MVYRYNLSVLFPYYPSLPDPCSRLYGSSFLLHTPSVKRCSFFYALCFFSDRPPTQFNPYPVIELLFTPKRSRKRLAVLSSCVFFVQFEASVGSDPWSAPSCLYSTNLQPTHPEFVSAAPTFCFSQPEITTLIPPPRVLSPPVSVSPGLRYKTHQQPPTPQNNPQQKNFLSPLFCFFVEAKAILVSMIFFPLLDLSPSTTLFALIVFSMIINL